MKKTQVSTIKLGIFVSIGIVLFIACIYFIGDKQQMFSSTFKLNSVFKDISGLQVGNNVRFSGINVGVVASIEQLTDSTVSVQMIIDQNTQKFIKKNATATIGSDGLMGNRLVLISPGTDGKHEIENNDNIESTQAVSTDEILLKLKTTAENSARISDDIAAIIGSIRSGNGAIGRLLMDSAFSKTMDNALGNINDGAIGFEHNMNALSHSVFLRSYLNKKDKNKEEIKEK